MAHDVRSVANYVLDIADREGATVTNMAINKIVYFIYVDYLLKFGVKLTNAKIEAWEHGPVFRELYSSFKSNGEDPIEERASRINPNTGAREKCISDLSTEEANFIDSLATKLVKISASRLRAISHEPGSPWHRVWNHKASTNIGMQITDELIVESLKCNWRH